MIISNNVIDRITDLLKMAGISNPEILDEMSDHYLSDIEQRVSAGEDLQNVIRSTYQTIATTDLKPIDQKHKNRKWMYALVLISVIGSMFYFYKTPDCTNYNAAPQEELHAQASFMPTGWPVNSSTQDVSSYFGMRMHPIQRIKKLHKGIDIRGAYGTPILATGDGEVVEVGTNNYLTGNYIIIRHNEEYSTKYTHLQKVNVIQFQKITKGDTIGEMGSSGLATAPHLHYEIHHNDEAINPMTLAL